MWRTTFLFCAVGLVAWAQKPVEFGEAVVHVGIQPLHVQVADTELARERGLMQRETVAPWDGMLFIFARPQGVSFWMKDTQIPLEVGYFDGTGVLQEIHPLMPYDTTPIKSAKDDILYALELPRGDFARWGLKIGQKLTIAQGWSSDKSVLK